jgi:dolichol-phosphate mannosyltransferase
MSDLAVIVPIYNEEEIIESVINEWIWELDKLDIDYKIFAYNDGSTDNSAQILEKISENNSKLIVINQKNSWHGPTVLRGYKENAPNFDWIFQTDSDREMGPEEFHNLWNKRIENDLIMVVRKDRPQNFVRKTVSLASRLCIRIFYGKGPWDANSPYRLMKSTTFIDLFKNLPKNTLSPNMIISGFTAKKKIKFWEHPVPCVQRYTGEVSLRKMKLIKTAVKSFWQAIIFSFRINRELK